MPRWRALSGLILLALAASQATSAQSLARAPSGSPVRQTTHRYWLPNHRCNWKDHGRYCWKHAWWHRHHCLTRNHPAYCRARRPRPVATTVAKTAPPSGGTWEYYETTAYCQTGNTADGTYTTWGVAAATLPFGTVLFVPGYGRAVVHDRGGAVGQGHIDLYMPDCTEALDWGVRYENIEIFE